MDPFASEIIYSSYAGGGTRTHTVIVLSDVTPTNWSTPAF